MRHGTRHWTGASAPDKAAFLQGCNPDLAIAIRRIWGPAEPDGRADRGGRSKR